jgi:hypothetical protein
VNNGQIITNDKAVAPKRKSVAAFYSLLFALLLLPFVSTAQYYETGVDDSKIKWRQIKTNDFHIVFPDYYEGKAQELARVLQTSHSNIGASLQVKKLPDAPFLIHPQSVNSNGLAVYAPKRVELWSLEPLDSYSLPWLWQLAIHEGRHTAQMKALYQRGGGKVLYKVFGEHIVGALLAIYVPYWFLEGDAVVAETSLAPVGRGDSPEFDFEFKARVLDKGKMKFDKAKMGSMKDFVPNRYNLGYHLVSFAREKYGKDIWGDVLGSISSDFWKLKAWGETSQQGLNIKGEKLYNEMIDSLTVSWKTEDSLYLQETAERNKNITELGNKNNGFINYYSPRFISKDSILALKVSYFQTPQLVLITGNYETKIVDLPFISDKHFDYRDNQIIFSQYYPDKRWQHTSFSDIVIYDLKTRKFNRLTHHQRLFLPYFDTTNSNGFSAISSDTLGNVTLTSSGYFIKTFPEGKAIVKYSNGKENLYSIPVRENLLKLRQIDNKVFYIKQIGYNYQLFSCPINDSFDVKCHTNVRFGLSDFDIQDSMLVISDYTANGYRIKTMPLQNMTATAFCNKQICDPNALRTAENFTLTPENVIDTTFESTKYNKAQHLFKFHSFAPFVFSMETQNLSLGISGLSQNLLGTSILQVGYKYRKSEKRDDLFLNYYYKGFYPVFNLQIDYLNPSIFNPSNVNPIYKEEFSSNLNLQMPLQWLGFRLSHSILPAINIGFRTVEWLKNYGIAGLGFTYQVLKPMAANDITPRFGESISFRTFVVTGKKNNNIISLTSTTYLPSLWHNHSFEFDFYWQERNNTGYRFNDLVQTTRGYETWLNSNPHPSYSNLIGCRLIYNMPLFYPDLSLWQLIYIKRIVIKPFYDVAWLYTNHNMQTPDYLSSFGSDILFNANFFRFETGVEIGARIGYSVQLQTPFASLLLNFNF